MRSSVLYAGTADPAVYVGPRPTRVLSSLSLDSDVEEGLPSTSALEARERYGVTVDSVDRSAG
jgi:hypothetical protein